MGVINVLSFQAKIGTNYQLSNQHFACDWLIRPLKPGDLSGLLSVCESLNCTLAYQNTLPLPDTEQTRRGFKVLRLVLEVPNEATLEKFKKQGAEQMGLTTWLPIAERDYQKGTKFDSMMSVVDFVQAAKVIGQANADLDRNLNKKT